MCINDVCRKLGEVGYKRSAEKCKEKFEEEESRYLSNINCNKSNRLQFNEFGDGNKLEKPRVVEEEGIGREEQDKDFLEGLNNVEKETTTKDKDQSVVDPLEDVRRKEKSKRKRKRGRDEEDGRFEALKGYCEEIVKKMMMQQEEMHLKLIEDMVKRDEEKIAIEEAWKKQEFDRVNKELEVRAHEQAIASDRQSTLIKFLISFTSSSTSRSSNGNWNHLFDDIISRSSIKVPTTSPPPLIQNHEIQNPSSNLNNPKPQQNPNSPKKHTPLSPNSISSKDKDDIGKRWPRDEVFALINLRCNIQNPNHHHQDKEEGQSRIPLWERISQGMLELGYKRSAKRCKEKWENINKYFRKTKDVNKKRSLDSRTCPYFHQLNTLYNQGTLLSSSPPPPLPLSSTTLPENQPGSSQAGSSSDSTLHQQQGDKILVQVPTFDFEH